MTGIRRIKRAKSLVETIKDNENESVSSSEVQPYELPVELLESVISRLSLRDNLRASSVCKRWKAAAISVRRANKAPWLMVFPKIGCTYEFYDPSQRKFYWLDLPELQGSRICYAKDGWLLLRRPENTQVFFHCPYTREVVNLPNLEMGYETVAFSSVPTCSTCLVFAVKQFAANVVTVSTCRPGAAQWTTVDYPSSLPFTTTACNKLVFCNGLFYSLSSTGRLGIYDHEKSTWSENSVPPPTLPESFSGYMRRVKFMAAHNEDVFVVCTISYANPVVYKLDQTKREWIEMKTFGGSGMTFFASFLSSVARTDLLGTTMRNSIYFSQLRLYGKRCISYSLDSCRYSPRNQFHDWWGRDPFRSVWVEPPQDLSVFGKRVLKSYVFMQ